MKFSHERLRWRQTQIVNMKTESITILQPLPKPEAKGSCAPSGGSDAVSDLNRKLLVSLGLSEASAKIVMTRICELEWSNKRLTAALQICQAESEMMWANVKVMTPEHQHRLARISDAATNAIKHQNARADLPPTGARQPRSGTESAIGG